MFQRKDGLWQEQITVETNGRKKQKYFYGKTKGEVKRKMTNYTGEVEKGPLFSDVAKAWYYEHLDEIAVNTRRNYDKPYSRILETFGDSRIRQITPKEIELFLKEVACQGYSQKTVSTHKLVCNLIFKYAVVQGNLPYNPCASVVTPRGKPKVTRELPSDDDIQRVKASCNLPLGLYHAFILYTGCRRGEAMAIRWSDIDYSKKTISISRSLYYDGAIPKVKEPKTAAGIREVPLLDALATLLPGGKPNQYVFFPSGDLPYKTTFERHLRQYRNASGVKSTPHQLRHAYATILYEAGVDEKAAQTLLGHASIQMTKDVYTHISAKRRSETADKLNAFLNGTETSVIKSNSCINPV